MRRVDSTKAAFLLLLASLPVLAAVYFLAAGRIIEHRQWQRFERGYSKHYSFSLNEVQWVKPGKEIRIHGRMMDLHSFRIHQGQLEVEGLWDEEETLLHKRFSQLPVSPAQGSEQLPRFLITLLFTPGLLVQPEWSAEKCTPTQILFSPCDSGTACGGYPSILQPPPRPLNLS